MRHRRNFTDWAIFSVLTLLWASAYAFTRLAVSRDVPESGLPPELIICTRLTLGSLILLSVAGLSGQSWPAFTAWRSWLAMLVMGGIGTAAPFYAITTAQQTINSSLAALYVAAAPLVVAGFAHVLFTDDRLSLRKCIGLCVGFMGVAVLFGPDAVRDFGSASMQAQSLCLMATVFYAIATITARMARHIPPFVFSAGFVTIAAIASWPLLVLVDLDSLNPSRSALVGVIGLALGPTALASILYLILVRRTSATFISLTGYTIPLVSTVIGFLAFGETQTLLAVLGFVLILGGVFLSQATVRRQHSQAKNTFDHGDRTSR